MLDQSAGELAGLRQELAALKAAMGGVTSTLERSQQAEAAAMVSAFASTHPRLEDNAFVKTVARLIGTRMADDLATAYDMADRLMPAPAAGAQADNRLRRGTCRRGSDPQRQLLHQGRARLRLKPGEAQACFIRPREVSTAPLRNWASEGDPRNRHARRNLNGIEHQ